MSISGISIIIPCFNEEQSVLETTINEIKKSLKSISIDFEIIVVDDGSTMNSVLTTIEGIKILRHAKNQGYGAALKTGIRISKFDWIGITDADGTYPNHLFHQLIASADDADMVVGARRWSQISGTRRLPKKILTNFASFLSGNQIPDLNSGMRIFKKDLAYQFWNLLPSGFSFTSTITMGALNNHYAVEFIPIDYFKRVGKSSINPIKDTFRFFMLVTRLALYFNPKKVFIPISLLFGILGILRGIRDYNLVGSLGGLCLILLFLSSQFFFFGLIAEIINKTRKYLIFNKNA